MIHARLNNLKGQFLDIEKAHIKKIKTSYLTEITTNKTTQIKDVNPGGKSVAHHRQRADFPGTESPVESV